MSNDLTRALNEIARLKLRVAELEDKRTPGQKRRDERNQLIVGALLAGEKVKTIAATFGLASAYIRHVGRACGVPPRAGGRRPASFDKHGAIADVQNGASIKATAIKFGVPYNYFLLIIRQYERESSERVPRYQHPDYVYTPRDPPRIEAVVDAYRQTPNLRTVGKAFNITGERVRQIVVRWEKTSGEKLPRGKAKGRRGPRAPRIIWACAKCGTERYLIPCIAKTAGPICRNCKSRIHISDAKIAEAIERVLAGEKWHPIALSYGYGNNSTWSLSRVVYTALQHAGRYDTIAQLWPRGIPRWLQKFTLKPKAKAA